MNTAAQTAALCGKPTQSAAGEILAIPRAGLHDGPLVVVNAAHPLRGSGQIGLAAVDDAFPGILMERRAARLLAACIRSVGGAGRIVPVSGWRSREEQQQIWNSSLAENGPEFTRSYVALPGCSEHQTGLAIDLGQAAAHIDFIRPDFPCDGVCGAFRRAAAGYGFIERYQKGREAVTGIACEPWHFRYVGVPHALLIEQNGLALEEYPAFLQAAPRVCALPGGRTAHVRYLPCRGEVTELAAPGGCFQISGDNIAGFIVTEWGPL